MSPVRRERASRSSRRRGPRTDVDVREALLDAAEDLCAAEGPAGPSARTIAARVGVNAAVVGYHFGSREGLIQAALERRGIPLLHRSRALLLALRSRRQRPTTRDVVEAVARPYLETLAGDPASGLRWIKLVAALALNRDRRWDHLARAVGTPSLWELFPQVLRRALPDVTPADLERRGALAMYSLLTSLSNVDAPAFGSPLGATGLDRAFAESLIDFTAAGLAGDLPTRAVVPARR
ncbi:MAG: TetR/AcrR family transcriptional regulator [Candidatus Binatia bacterium]